MFIIKLLVLAFGIFLFTKFLLGKKKTTTKSAGKGKTGKGVKSNGYFPDDLKPKNFKNLRGSKILLVGAFYAVILGVLFVAGLFAFYAKDLPNPGKINKRIITESTKIYDRTGEHLLYELHGEEKRTIISIDKIPDTVKYATIVLEDQGFYSHYGVDFQGIMRAALKDVIKGSAAQGGSTITQQFVKNSILTSEKRISRKIKEVILAIEIEQKFTKEEILGMYLNEIPYGSNAYGIEAAAQTFFAKSASELTLAQSALLAALPNAPTFYSPHGSHTDRLLYRWEKALDGMADLGYITEEQAEEAKKEDILSQVKPFRDNIQAPHFALYVKEKIVEEFGEEEVEQIGMKVYTTLDWDLQQKAEQAVREGVEEHGPRYKFENAALVATNPKNGQVLAMVGSKNYFDEEIDGNVNVAIRMRQPGSSFKPYVYAQAFAEGYTPDTILFDVPTSFGKDGSGNKYKPVNYDGTYRGAVKMKNALATSLNVPAVKALYLAGVKDSVGLAKDMGITTLDNPDRLGLSLVLGGGEVKLIDHVGAFGVFANEGEKHDQKVIMRIEDASGKELKNYEDSKGERVLDKQVARQVTEILSKDEWRAPAFGAGSHLSVPGVQVAAKTGTTNEYRDGWLIGATPSLAVGVWAGNNDNTAMAAGAAGVNVAGPIWNQFMVEATKNYQKEEFTEPEKDEDVKKDILEGKLDIVEKLDVCDLGDDDYCLRDGGDCDDGDEDEKKFFVAHNILYYVDKDDPRGDRPDNPKDDPQYRRWEEALEEWAEEHADGKGRDMAPDDDC
jgi:1A family penicillin-binding protein